MRRLCDFYYAASPREVNVTRKKGGKRRDGTAGLSSSWMSDAVSALLSESEVAPGDACHFLLCVPARTRHQPHTSASTDARLCVRHHRPPQLPGVIFAPGPRGQLAHEPPPINAFLRSYAEAYGNSLESTNIHADVYGTVHSERDSAYNDGDDEQPTMLSVPQISLLPGANHGSQDVPS